MSVDQSGTDEIDTRIISSKSQTVNLSFLRSALLQYLLPGISSRRGF